MSRNLQFKKKLLEYSSQKYNIKPHCLMDEVLLYLRYMEDYFKPHIKREEFPKSEEEFHEELYFLYKRYRTIYAENPSVFISIKVTTPTVVASYIFYLALIITDNQMYGRNGMVRCISQSDITSSIRGGQMGLPLWHKVIKILKPDMKVEVEYR